MTFTPAEIASRWSAVKVVFDQIAFDIKTLTFGVASKRDEGQVNAQIDNKFAEWTGLAPAAYNTFQKLAAEMAEDDTEFATLATIVGGKADSAFVVSLLGRVEDLESIFGGVPDLLAAYNAAKQP
jgi:hypothetical protein